LATRTTASHGFDAEPASGGLSIEASEGNEDRFREVYDLVARLAVPGSLDETLTEVVRASMQVVGADAGSIRLFDLPYLGSIQSRYPFVAHIGLSERYVRYFTDLPEPVYPQARLAIAAGRRVIVDDMYTHPAFLDHLDVVVAEGYRSLQATPLLSGNGSRAIGDVRTYFVERYTPPAEAFETLDLYAELAASAIERHRQIAELSRRRAELTTRIEERRDSLQRIHDQLERLESRAFALEPEDVRRLARSIDLETQRSLDDVTPSPASRDEAGEPGVEFPYGLSEREMDVLMWIWKGLSDKQIALAMGISRFTVFKHVRMVLQKLGADTRTQAGVRAEHEGLYRYMAEAATSAGRL
jgi:DNA-binding CsgD family transcriptional regulator/GAF domain-containing protein